MVGKFYQCYQVFTDRTPTKLIPDCIGRYLNKGEIAIILADRIEGMPYAKVTGVQNYTLTFVTKIKILSNIIYHL